jgi:hypothetical protein
MKTAYSSLATLACLLTFALIVVHLQAVQEGYDWHGQFISELALGKQGWLMSGAFLAVALACVSFALTLRSEYQNVPSTSRFQIKHFLIVSLIAAAIAFLGAGLVTLQDDAMTHITFVLFAFVVIMITMFTVLRTSPRLELRIGAISAIFIVALALLLVRWQILESGAGQRLSAAGILGWMAHVEVSLLIWSRPLPRGR